MKISKELKTGILVLLGIALFIFGFNYLKGQNLLDSSNIYHTEFDYNALNESSPVTVKGNVVGKINNIEYNFETGKTRVSFFVNSKLRFSKSTKVKLYETGLMGGNGLAILVDSIGETAESGTFLQSEVESGLISNLTENFSGLSTDLNTTLKSTDTLLVNLNKIVADESENGLKSTIKELNSTLKSFKNTSNSVNGLIKTNDENISVILEKFKVISADFAVLSKELKSANLSNTVETLNTSLNKLNNVITKVNKGEGMTGKLVNDEELYNNLVGATKELEELLRDIKLHPKRYFRILSKKEIPYKDEETN